MCGCFQGVFICFSVSGLPGPKAYDHHELPQVLQVVLHQPLAHLNILDLFDLNFVKLFKLFPSSPALYIYPNWAASHPAQPLSEAGDTDTSGSADSATSGASSATPGSPVAPPASSPAGLGGEPWGRLSAAFTSERCGAVEAVTPRPHGLRGLAKGLSHTPGAGLRLAHSLGLLAERAGQLVAPPRRCPVGLKTHGHTDAVPAAALQAIHLPAAAAATDPGPSWNGGRHALPQVVMGLQAPPGPGPRGAGCRAAQGDSQ